MLEKTETLFRLMQEREMTIAVGESCTGGELSAEFTSVPGASKIFLGGIVAYTIEAKTALLGVSKELMAENGAISRETAQAMAKGVAEATGANIGMGITGVAGPAPMEGEEPGIVHVAIWREGKSLWKKLDLKGQRESIRRQIVDASIALLLDELFGQKI